jgi:hypothetical protein
MAINSSVLVSMSFWSPGYMDARTVVIAIVLGVDTISVIAVLPIVTTTCASLSDAVIAYMQQDNGTIDPGRFRSLY